MADFDSESESRSIGELILILFGILATSGLILFLIGLLIYLIFFKSPFKASPSGILLNARVPANPLSRVVYPYLQPVHWSQLPTGATQLTTLQGSGRMAF